MPAPGDQHNIVVNPFEEAKPRVSEYTAQEIATLQSRLEKQLGPEYLSSRAGPSGQKVHYIAAEKCIALANEVFGFNGWSSSIQNIQVDFVDEHPQTLKISLGLSVIVRVTLRDGTFHEDIGYGHIENCKGKAAAFEKAKKEGTTDGLKRALRNFGNVLGNCIYDKAYLAKVTKMKVEPTKFDVDGLHRHSDFTIKREPMQKEAPSVKAETGALVNVPASRVPLLQSEESFEDFLGDIDEADFNITEEGHPDEVVLPAASNQTSSTDRPQAPPPQNHVAPMNPPSRGLMRSGSAGSNYSRPPHTPNHQPPSRPNGAQNSFNSGAQNHAPNGNGPRGPAQQQFNNHNRPATHHPTSMNQNPQAQMTPPQPKYQPPAAQNGAAAAAAPPPGDAAVGFFSARAVKDIPEDSLNNGQAALAPKAGQVFNPRAESPSIRKTPGIDHTKSKPLARNGQHVPAIVSEADAPLSTASAGAGPAAVPRPIAGGLGTARGNIYNPQFDQARRIGAPGASSPLANRGQYRPPTMKRPAADNPGQQAAGRAPLAEVSSNAPATTGTTTTGAAGGNAGANGGPDFKRQRVG
ncbi:recombination protein rad52 [Cercophora scortea]|uniref:RAD52 homolog n=1 Tax=Cercophora scortea TaxID=314031 RepID=A0AAE0IN55_9PEZI|nr:recombination protein rad52 [Cercophora scortea]